LVRSLSAKRPRPGLALEHLDCEHEPSHRVILLSNNSMPQYSITELSLVLYGHKFQSNYVYFVYSYISCDGHFIALSDVIGHKLALCHCYEKLN